jgi:hypothetical protein
MKVLYATPPAPPPPPDVPSTAIEPPPPPPPPITQIFTEVLPVGTVILEPEVRTFVLFVPIVPIVPTLLLVESK